MIAGERHRIREELRARREKKLTEFFQFIAMKFSDREMYERAAALARNDTLGVVTAKLWCQWMAKQAGSHGSREMELAWKMLDSLETEEPGAQPCAAEVVKMTAAEVAFNATASPPADSPALSAPPAPVLPLRPGEPFDAASNEPCEPEPFFSGRDDCPF